MQAKSVAQQQFMGAALARKRAGHPAPNDPKMSTSDLRHFAATKQKNLPQRVQQGGYGRAFS